MAAYEKRFADAGEELLRALAMLRLMGLFDRPVDQGCLTALCREPVIPGFTESLVDQGAVWLRIDAQLAEALRGFHAGGDMAQVPRGYLTRAWSRFVKGDAEGARADLEEAQQVAERGPMRLHLADVHLHRARIFRDRAELQRARILIEQCGYGRRKGEFEDVEEAAGTW